MTPRRLQWLLAFITAVSGAVLVYAQNPISIAQVGTTAVGSTVPVSGTVATTQSGTWTVQPGNTANTTAWKVDGSAVTQPVSVADAANVTLGAKADAKSTATDTTSVTIMSVLKQISASVQAPPSQAVTNAGTFATQSAVTAASGSIASGAVASGAVASGAFASGSLAAGACAVGCLPPAAGTLVSGVVTSAMTSTTSTALVAAAASNNLYITSCAFSNTHASVSTLMELQDGSGGTVLWVGNVPFGAGSNITFPVPLKVPTQGNGLYVVNVTTGSNTYASCSGFKSTTSY